MSLDNNLKKTDRSKHQSKIEKLPESARKKILVITLIVVMTIILMVWLIFLSFNLDLKEKEKVENENESWQEIKKDVNLLFKGIEHSVNEMKSTLNQIQADQTTTPELLSEDNEIEKLKEKLMEKKNDN